MTCPASIGSLDVELLATILEFVDDDSPKTTKSVALVNKYFNSVTKLVCHRKKVIFYASNHATTNQIIQQWLRDEDLLRGIRHLLVQQGRPRFTARAQQLHQSDGAIDDDSEVDSEYGPLTTLIQKAGNLKILTWGCHKPVPLEVLKSLHQYHPKAELRVYNFTRSGATVDHNDAAEIALANSPALTVIRAHIWDTVRGSQPDLRRAAFERIVANAPNLKHASISTGRIVQVLTPQGQPDEGCAAKFYTHKKPNSSIRILTLDGFALSEETLRYWSRFVDLSRLENLKWSRGRPQLSYFQSAPGLLKSLKHISLNLTAQDDNADLRAAVENYIATCPPLETLSLWSWMGTVPLSTILVRHGPTLKVLQLHERETTARELRKVLTTDDVKAIRESCPNLCDFTLDLNRKSLELSVDDDREMLAELQKLKKLSKLQLYFDLGIAYLHAQSGPPVLSPDDQDSEGSNDDDDGEDDGGEGEGGEDDDDHHDNDDEANWYGDPAGDGTGNDTATVTAAVVDGGPSMLGPLPATGHLPTVPSPVPSTSQSSRKAVRKQVGLFERAIKRQRQTLLPPSEAEDICRYVEGMWKMVFGHRITGARILDVKFGEYERKPVPGYMALWTQQEQRLKSWWRAEPEERDDRPGECTVIQMG